MEILTKELIGYISVFIGIAVMLPYIWLITKKQVRPHAITFFLWTLIMGSVATIQVLEGAGSGAWATIVGFIGVMVIFLLALFHHGEKNILKFDWYCFAVALLGWGAWIVTKNPLTAVLLLTLADGLAYLPTFRKSWASPHEESPIFYFFGTFSLLLSVFAIENFSITNAFYPIFVTFLNFMLPAMIWYRRAQLKN